ncbi:MAG: non-canonical purine NTP pyrophosphatase, partial [Clostridia bacterium]|nr:non-canonical purine NTP pyrophosphatase [Clostridia bacterium]
MKLLLATNNAHKAQEIREILKDSFTEIVTMRDAGIELDVVEDGATFRENALKKAIETLDYAKDRFDAVLADDSGLCVDALNGAPGVFSARFSGEGHDDAANNSKLIRLLHDVPFEQRTARFCCCVALARREHAPIAVQGEVEGKILFEARGENGFGYDPYFYYEPFGK